MSQEDVEVWFGIQDNPDIQLAFAEEIMEESKLRESKNVPYDVADDSDSEDEERAELVPLPPE